MLLGQFVCLYGMLSQDIQETLMDWFQYRHLAVFGFFNKAIGHFIFSFFFWGGFRPAEGFPLDKNQEMEILVLWKQV